MWQHLKRRSCNSAIDETEHVFYNRYSVFFSQGGDEHCPIPHKEMSYMSDISETPGKTNAWPKAIFAITLFTEDLEAAKAFYQKVFGLPVHYEDPNSAVFKFGDTMVNLLKI